MDTATSSPLDQAWAVSPTTVYGLLLLLLLIAVTILWRENMKNTKALKDLLARNIEVISAFTSKFDGDGKDLADEQLKTTLRGVVQTELQAINRKLNSMTQQKS